MDIDLKLDEVLINYKNLNMAKDFQTFAKYTSFDIKQEDFYKQSNLTSLIQKYSSKFFKDPVLLKNNGDSIAISYLVIVKNNILLIEVSNIYGNIELKSKEKLIVSFTSNQSTISTSKENPEHVLNKFLKQLKIYNRNLNFKIDALNIKKIVLFNNEVKLINNLNSNDCLFLKIEDFEEYLENLHNGDVNLKDYIVPSYDKGYISGEGFFNLVLLNKFIYIDNKKIELSDFKYIVFNDDFQKRDLLVEQDDTKVYLKLKKNKIKTNNKTNIDRIKIDAIILNDALHYLLSTDYELLLTKNSIKSTNTRYVISIISFSLLLIIALVFLVLYLLSKNVLDLSFLIIFSSFFFISFSLFIFYLIHYNILKKKEKKLEKYILDKSKPDYEKLLSGKKDEIIKL